jgi:hypothetical protein
VTLEETVAKIVGRHACGGAADALGEGVERSVAIARRLFALSERDIEREAIKVIWTEFGYAGGGRWDDDERARRKSFQAEDSSHSHGSYLRRRTPDRA